MFLVSIFTRAQVKSVAVTKIVSSSANWNDVSKIIKYYAFKIFARNCQSNCVSVPRVSLSGYQLSKSFKQSVVWHQNESGSSSDEELIRAYKDVTMLLLNAAQEINRWVSGQEKFEVDLLFAERVGPQNNLIYYTDHSFVILKHKTRTTLVEVTNEVQVNFREENECAVARLLLQAYYILESAEHRDRRMLCILTDTHTWHCFGVKLADSLEIESFITISGSRGTTQLTKFGKVLCLIINTLMLSAR